MNEELDAWLCSKYPEFFRFRNEAAEDSWMKEGFACGDGWFTLIDVMSELLVKHDPAIFAVQIKEKLGGLCFDHSATDDYSSGVQMAAEILSKYVCDVCGAPGILDRSGNWWATRCASHAIGADGNQGQDIEISDAKHLKLGEAWTRLMVILKKLADWHVENNNATPSLFFINVSHAGRMNIQFARDDEVMRGMADVIAVYCNRVEEQSGLVI